MKNHFTEALEYASRLCSMSEQCRLDVEEKIRRFELEEEEVQSLLDQLEKDNFLNEQRYARAYVNDKFQLNKWGRVKIKSYLRHKQLPASIIDEALSGLDEARYAKTLLDLMRRKDRNQRSSTIWERRAKLYRFALGRGFEVPLVNTCLNEYLGKSDDSFEE